MARGVNLVGAMLFILLTLLYAMNAGWMVGVILPEATVDVRARLLAGVAGGAAGTLLFELLGPSLVSVLGSIACALAAGVLVVLLLKHGPRLWSKSGAARARSSETPSVEPFVLGRPRTVA